MPSSKSALFSAAQLPIPSDHTVQSGRLLTAAMTAIEIRD
jgi:hypothetical protein